MLKNIPRNVFWGLLHRRECLIPTWRGFFFLMLFVATSMGIAALNIHPFLAVTDPVQAEVLVVEGWVPDYVLAEAKNEFKRHSYRKLYVVGGLLEYRQHLSEHEAYLEFRAATLVRMGMSKSAVEAVAAPWVQQDRTYTSALALKNWLHQQMPELTSMNLISVGAHARRSQLLFQKAFGKDIQVGVIAIEDREYDPNHWWKFSAGVRSVIDELIAYIYAVVVFPFV